MPASSAPTSESPADAPPSSPRHVLVTGAFGNIGQNAVAALRERGHRVRALRHDASVTEGRHARALARAFGPRVEVVRGDVRDREAMDRAVRGVDCVVHLAFVIPPRALSHPRLAESVNVAGTRTVLAAARAAERPPRFVFASTLDVYGHTQHLAPPRKVTDPVSATDAYSAHKIACEVLVRESELAWSILRFADVPPIAVRSPHPIMFRIPLATRIEALHPRDAGRAVAAVVESEHAWGRVWNIGGGPRCQLTYREYLGAFLDAMGIGALPDEAFGREPYCTDWLDSAESEQAFRYQSHGFDDIVRETAALLGWRRPLARAARPLVRRAILWMSPYWRAARRRRNEPERE